MPEPQDQEHIAAPPSESGAEQPGVSNERFAEHLATDRKSAQEGIKSLEAMKDGLDLVEDAEDIADLDVQIARYTALLEELERLEHPPTEGMAAVAAETLDERLVDPADRDEKYATAATIQKYLDRHPLDKADNLADLLGRLNTTIKPETVSASGLELLKEAVGGARENEELLGEFKTKFPRLDFGSFQRHFERIESLTKLRVPRYREVRISDTVADLKNADLPNSDRLKKLSGIIGDARLLDRKNQDEIWKRLGPEFIHALKNEKRLRLEDYARTSGAGVGVGFDLECADPKMADEFHEHMLDVMKEGLEQKEPSGEAGFYLPATMGAVYARLAKGEQLPPDFQEKLSAVLKLWQKHPELAKSPQTGAALFDTLNSKSFVKRNMARITGEDPTPEVLATVSKAVEMMMK